MRLLGGGTDSVTPRRARCRQCDRTLVFIPVRAFPRRTDSIETVWAALAAAAQGLGHRKVAEQVGVPATTVRGWLRRARANSDIIANRARIFRSDLERYKPDRLPKFDTPLACMVMAVELFGATHVVYFALACSLAYLCSGHTGIYLSQRLGVPKGRLPEGILPGTTIRQLRERRASKP